MHFKELFKMSLLQTDCRSLFTAMRRAALSFGVICVQSVSFCCSEHFGELVNISFECAVYRHGQKARREFWQKHRTCVPGKTLTDQHPEDYSAPKM